MRIKLNFTNPLAVSPNLRYDKLCIYLGDSLKLFDHVSERRALSHVRYDSLMTKPIQKQMFDDPHGRKMIKLAYDIRYALSFFFILFLVLAMFFRSPFDRMLKMMLELQLMVNLALMHIHLPGNAMVALAIFKPLTDFKFKKELG